MRLLLTILRKTVKWAGAAVSLLLTALWITSFFTAFWIRHITPATRSSQIQRLLYVTDLDRGCLVFGPPPYGYLPTFRGFSEWSWGFTEPRRELVLRPFISRNQSSSTFIPLWCPLSFVLAPTAFAWFLDFRASRRVRKGACLKCDYDRTGLAPTALCPECGAHSPRAAG